MLRKRFYTQGLAILLRQAVTLDAIEELLTDFTVVKRTEASTIWTIAGPTLLLAYRPEVNGYVSVDVVDHCWPDRMGDPETDPDVWGAWNMGHFGPGAWPGSLERACQHSWGWPEGRSIPLQHQAFIRILSSYTFGLPNVWTDVPENYDAAWAATRPKDYDPVHELTFVTRVAAALVRLPQALCYFNPNGECVRDASQLLDCLNDHASAEELPWYVWSNVRFFKLEDAKPVWNLMDTVGLSQLDAPDHEAFFELAAYKPGEVNTFLRVMSSYLVNDRPIIRDGDTTDGPGNVRWQGFNLSEARVAPPRPVIRWFPLDRRKIPAELAKGPTPTFMSWKDRVRQIFRPKPPRRQG